MKFAKTGEYLKKLSYIIFPNRCLVCDEIVPPGVRFCEKCLPPEPIEGKICARCALPFDLCRCNGEEREYCAAAAAFLNAEDAQRIVYSFKIEKRIDKADFLAESMAKTAKDRFSGVSFDLVTAVPTKFTSRAPIGFDHSEILAKRVANILKIRYSPALYIKKSVKRQHTLSAKERAQNVKDAYSSARISGGRVLLIDDIQTTGATLNECSRALLSAGAGEVYCLCAVVTPIKIHKTNSGDKNGN